jgi:hypothetical protein
MNGLPGLRTVNSEKMQNRFSVDEFVGRLIHIHLLPNSSACRLHGAMISGIIRQVDATKRFINIATRPFDDLISIQGCEIADLRIQPLEDLSREANTLPLPPTFTVGSNVENQLPPPPILTRNPTSFVAIPESAPSSQHSNNGSPVTNPKARKKKQ